jgi:uncharacterized protein YbaA (DUF1428 family)
MPYVDGFLVPVPRKNLQAYRRMSQKAGKVWRDHGAIEYRECSGDDLEVKMGKSFPRSMKLKRGETPVFAWIVYKSRADRDRVNKKVSERSAPRKDDGSQGDDALRLEAHGLRRI